VCPVKIVFLHAPERVSHQLEYGQENTFIVSLPSIGYYERR
jgi:hypothetical protein